MSESTDTGARAAGAAGGRTAAANAAWESLLTAHAVLMRRFLDEGDWSELSMREYDVLYTLRRATAPLRLSELNRRVLLSQPALSRMVDRLVGRGLVARERDPDDGRGVLLSLTDGGRAAQRRAGRAHALSVGAALTAALDDGELGRLTALCTRLAAGGTDTAAPTRASRPTRASHTGAGSPR